MDVNKVSIKNTGIAPARDIKSLSENFEYLLNTKIFSFKDFDKFSRKVVSTYLEIKDLYEYSGELFIPSVSNVAESIDYENRSIIECFFEGEGASYSSKQSHEMEVMYNDFVYPMIPNMVTDAMVNESLPDGSKICVISLTPIEKYKYLYPGQIILCPGVIE